MTALRHLKAVPKTRGQRVLDYRCDLVTQAVLGGDIDFRVQAMSPVVGPGPGTIFHPARPGRAGHRGPRGP